MATIRCLLTAIIESRETEIMTARAYVSTQSRIHTIDTFVDTKRYKHGLAEAWNNFFDYWRGKDYDYLMFVSNDNQLHEQYVDYLIDYFENDAPKDIGVVSARQFTDATLLQDEVDYSTKLMYEMHTSSFIIMPGVIEKVGRVDEQFPLEFIERDYFRRCNLAGIKTVSLDMPLLFHPQGSQTIGNPQERLMIARDKYIAKWGGDALHEVYMLPYNDPKLDYTYTKL